MSQEIRAEIVNRLIEDIVGPHDFNEKLRNRPSDIYLSGALWPRQARQGQEDDFGNFDEDDSNLGPGTGSIVGQQRPCSMGISFAVSGETSRLEVNVLFATYEAIEATESPSGKNKILWSREEFSQKLLVQVDALTSSIQVIQIGAHEPSKAKLHVRQVTINTGKLVTVTLLNSAETSETDPADRNTIEQQILFQTRISVKTVDGEFIPKPNNPIGADFDSRMSALLYSQTKSFATGHQCSAKWEGDGSTKELSSTWIPVATVPAFSESGSAEFRSLVASGELSANKLGQGNLETVVRSLRSLTASYQNWIKHKTDMSTSLDTIYSAIANDHLDECRRVLARMEKGIDLLESDPLVFAAFQLSMSAMHIQHSWKNLGDLVWRPFQLGFVLLSLESSCLSNSVDREVLDLLWFPTGGGKTEAYLALISIVAWYRTLRFGDGGCVAFMRYTLRLLTAQQFERAAALILASELLRKGTIEHQQLIDVQIQKPFSIGLWVGGDATPNRFEDALAYKEGRGKSSPEQLSKCPLCGSKLLWNYDVKSKVVSPFCKEAGCLLGKAFGGWPVYTVDENVYKVAPTLIIGTVDKFAQLTFKSETKQMFGFRGELAPDLVIQDELHLISGPLGTLVGIYETALDWLLTKNGAKPKIIGSTATIKKASEQVRALFDRTSCQFPPPGLDADDSGFAVVDPNKPGRLYAGVSSAGRSAKFTLQAVAGSLMQSGGPNEAFTPTQRDGYSTLLLYFNSLRELGGAIVQILDDVPDSIGLYASSRGEERRLVLHHEEMTSRKPQDEILRILEELKITCDSEYFVDAVLATNMVSVGVDISRLGLMLVNGQPKTRAEYIQSTSRVGRSTSPGLIVSVLNAAKPRDRSHFETFQTWHSSIYKDVEATSVTPFAPRARDKALKAVLVTMVRQGISGLGEKPVRPSDIDADRIDEILFEILRRVSNISPDESLAVEKEIDSALDEWERRSPTHYENPGNPDTALIQRAEEQARRLALRKKPLPAWPVMNSMRNVEPSTKFRLAERLKSSGIAQDPSDSEPNGDQSSDKVLPTWRKNRGK
jgi:hypothetical protein